jgi:hypothetical protein
MGDSPVMLSAAKHLSAHRDRPFASLRVTVERPISSSVLFFETPLRISITKRKEDENDNGNTNNAGDSGL